MTDRIFFDTNIIVYLFDTSEKEKRRVVKHLFSEQRKKSSLYISSQVINEFVSITTRKIQNPVSFERQKNILKFFQVVFIVSPLTIHTSLTAVEMKLKYRFSYWDSLILASALENRCSVIYSEDMQHNQEIESSIKIINPFKY
ncbi:PIN domain-containing protein [Desulfonema limicola]|uniref:PIN domain-containing protein n=1 Tax=Desulfonema limicola TaxID=45656 RepID=A0A975B872_9BACT|nr:PIN domain-containing protein [Desulfonema limicola]QTA80779.1 PIN domain-containing protein [Desulfonema limicola]